MVFDTKISKKKDFFQVFVDILVLNKYFKKKLLQITSFLIVL